MKQIRIALLPLLLLTVTSGKSQPKDSAMVASIVAEGTRNSMLEKLGYALLDSIGPRLVGTPQMKQAHDWVVQQYSNWGIDARNEQWGEWRSWQRGITHIDMIQPRVKTLEGMQLAWSPSTNGKTITAETIILADVADSMAFQQWLPAVKGKFVLISMCQPTGRPDYNWEEFGLKESFERMKKKRTEQTEAWRKRISKTGYGNKELVRALENAGAVGIITSNWSSGFGVNKIFGASTLRVPTIDIALEDYGTLYRLTEAGAKPVINVKADSKDLGMAPTFNTLATIKGSEKPEEYVMLSAHLDSWDGATGATDNGTGTLVMMEALRILKKVYPNPKRTILVGHWGSEEQGLNGSRAFIEDNPEIVSNIQALFNQDNGTGRVVSLAGQGFLHSYEYLGRWLAKVPDSIKGKIETSFPGAPDRGGSDYASFVAAGVPAFSLSSNSWLYGNYTWHTNRDTYDKIVFDDVRSNAILAAIMVYMACEDPASTSKEKAVLPVNSKTGEPAKWPEQKKAKRKGGVE